MDDTPLPPAARRPDRVDRLDLPESVGRYEVKSLLGEGSMGRVLLAHDPVLDRDVAVKHLRGDLRIPREVKEALLKRMRHEARAAARVAHPNLVVLHDMGEDDEVGLYLVFEYVAGLTLKQRIRKGPLPPSEVRRLAVELGGALSLAHDAGILHRDVKPENVILAANGAKVADFGIARIPDSTLTHQGGLLGTPAYSAPETFRSGEFSPASDQFSLAATLFEALAGQRPFAGEDAVAVTAAIAHEAPPELPDALGLPKAASAVLVRALSRRPEERFASCAELGAALDRALAAPVVIPVGPVPVELGERSPTEIPRQRRLGQVIVGGLVVVGTAALVLRAALHGAEAQPAEQVSVSAPAPPVASSAAPVRAKPHPSAPRPRAHAESSARPTASSAVDDPDAGARGGSMDAVIDGGAAPLALADAGPAPIASSSAGAPAPPLAADAGAKLDAGKR